MIKELRLKIFFFLALFKSFWNKNNPGADIS